jgi:hypothetical protein
LLSRFAHRRRGWSSLRQGTDCACHRWKHHVDGEFVRRRFAALAAYGYLSGFSVALAVGLIGPAHVGFERLLGYGLKYPLGSGYTHLGPASGKRLSSCLPWNGFVSILGNLILKDFSWAP